MLSFREDTPSRQFVNKGAAAAGLVDSGHAESTGTVVPGRSPARALRLPQTR
jgi:hypothetical protein